MTLSTQIALGLLLAVPTLGQTPTAAPAVPILLEAALPVYPPIWRAAHLSGKVIVRVTVKNGRVTETAIQSGEPHLQVPTTSNLKTWRFDDQVFGAFTVTYTYEISGKPTDNPTNPRVEMLPSLDVKITARPVKPTVNYNK
ncbi:MAG: energy transducer TonB [Bryobacteraceae bacterium]